MMSFFLIILLTHPLDNGPYKEIDYSKINRKICIGDTYISPINGVIEEIILKNNKYTIKISNDFTEIVFVDLDKIYKTVDEEVKMGDEIGVDYNITIYTEILQIQYNNNTLLPQFNNNKLYFNTEIQGSRIYPMAPGIVSIVTYDSGLRGNFLEIITNNDNGIYSKIQYWHNLIFRVKTEQKVDTDTVISHIGNTGLSYKPHLTVFFTDSIYDLRAIYIKMK